MGSSPTLYNEAASWVDCSAVCCSSSGSRASFCTARVLRGFAGLDGSPTERSLDADARAAYEYVRSRLHVPPERIVIYGWSLGSAVAVDLASRVDESALILEGAPASLVAVGQRRYP